MRWMALLYQVTCEPAKVMIVSTPGLRSEVIFFSVGCFCSVYFSERWRFFLFSFGFGEGRNRGSLRLDGKAS